jgi:hypothetical protein
LLVGHGRIRCAEVDGQILDALDPATRANALVVDLEPCEAGVFVEPLLIQRRRERGAGAGKRAGFALERAADGDLLGIGRRAADQCAEQEEKRRYPTRESRDVRVGVLLGVF